MRQLPWDQRIARVMVRPLAQRSVSPHTITTATLWCSDWAARRLFAGGSPAMMNAGALLFVLARFLDHLDGELARQTDRASRAGYYYDYVAGAASYAALFLALGLCFRDGALEGWSVALGLAGAATAVLCAFLSLDMDSRLDTAAESDAWGYPRRGRLRARGRDLSPGAGHLARMAGALFRRRQASAPSSSCSGQG